MAEAVASLGLEADVATTTANGRSEIDVPPGGVAVENGVRYFYFPRQHPKSWTFSLSLTKWLTVHAGKYDLFHVHALFSYPTLAACWLARRHAVPYILRPLGTLDPWALRFRAWKKAPYLRLVERRNLIAAAAVHAVSERERRAIEALGLPVRVVTIPLGVDLPAGEDRDQYGSRVHQATNGTVNVLFLSRLHPKKGVELLLDAVGRLGQQHPIHLSVAGEGDEAYVRSLKDRTIRDGLGSRVTFTGFVAGAVKRRLFEQADLFVLPSYDENFGMAVAEALSTGLPVVVTEDVALANQVRAAGAGLVVPRDARALARALCTLVDDPDLRQRMGEAGRQLAKSEFSWSSVGQRLAALYRELMADRSLRQAT
jgi:glycosyltransferase involved in cell wall biosynthesis